MFRKDQRLVFEKDLREAREPTILGKSIPDGGTARAKALNRIVTEAK